MTSECFQMRKLLWDELKLRIRASEEAELRAVVGNYLIAENEELQKELAALGEILTEFQQQNDNIRDALLKRPRVPEPPGRPLLLEKLKMLATDLHRSSPRIPVQSHKEMEILEYVLSAGEDSNGSYDHQACRGPPSTPRMVDLQHSVGFPDRQDGAVIIPIRPGTSGGAKRPLTSGSQRPISRGSTVSMSSVSTLLDSAELHQQLNLEQIDAVKDDLQDALMEERQQLLEDIDFIQSCLEMEQDLIDEDRRTATKPPPSLNELHAFSKSLEKTLEDQREREKVEALLARPEMQVGSLRRSTKILSASDSKFALQSPDSPELQQLDLPSPTRPNGRLMSPCSLEATTPPQTGARRESRTRVLKIRHVIQESRDEPYFS